MRRIKNKFLSLVSLIPVALLLIAGCAVRFYQLVRCTDKDTGLILDRENALVVPLYLMIAAAVILSLIYSAVISKRDLHIFFIDNKGIYITLLFLCVSFFIDFIYKFHNVYRYVVGTQFVEYNYIIPLIISGAFALLSSFYVLAVSRTVNGSFLDFRRFTLFHFVPAAWALMRLISLMVKIVDFHEGPESFCEFLFLISFVFLLFACLSALDRNSSMASFTIVFLALTTLILSFILALPRMMTVLFGKADCLYAGAFSSVTYLAIGLFSLSLLGSVYTKEKCIK